MATLLCLIITTLLGRTLDLVKSSSFHVSNCSRWNCRTFVCVQVLLYYTGREMIKIQRVEQCQCVCVCMLRVIHHFRVSRMPVPPRHYYHTASNQPHKKIHLKWATHSHVVKGHWEHVRAVQPAAQSGGQHCTSFAVPVRIRQMNVGGTHHSGVICLHSAMNTKSQPQAMITFTRISQSPEHTCK